MTPTPQAPSADESKPYVKKITPGGLIYISYNGPIHDEPEPEASPDPYEPVAPPSTTPSAEAQEAAEQEAILASMTEAAIETGSYVQAAIDAALNAALASSAAEIAELRNALYAEITGQQMAERELIALETDSGQEIAELGAERDKLQAFKNYVHSRLDAAGVPVDPESTHKAEGCRIGGRLDCVFSNLAELREKLATAEEHRDEARAVLQKIANYPEAETLWDDDRDDAAQEIVNLAAEHLKGGQP